MRAYCHLRQKFLDFVIGRILSIEGSEQVDGNPPCNAQEDAEWHNMVRLILAPHPELSAAHRNVIELDYGMSHGVVELECRQALLFYVLKHFGLNAGADTRPEAQQIILSNQSEIAQYLPHEGSR